MPPSASLVFLSCSRSLTSPRCRALPPAAQAARSLMAREKQMPPSASLVFLSCSLYREHSSLNSFAVRDEQASPVPALLRSLYHEPALTRFIACYAGCSFSNGTRKTNAAFGVACFSLVLIILQHFTSFVHCFPTRGTFYEKGSCKAGFSACGGSRKRHSTIPPQCDHKCL